ncbi:MoaD/ThiS family protein [Flavimarina sp. Hel_I_48]|uniref:MoaD/ThiS family protein n=1 Tax=Flavimarina sp. Hel_I_48 TaxID=1392488 RepID=UPI0004DF2E71|nr:MoaD/ThiS family protein [Flavimarina sp. Hel_I_48]
MQKVHYYGEIADKTGCESEQLTLPNTTLFNLLLELQKKYNLEQGDFQVALNHNLIDPTQELKIEETDEIAILSAFAGG